MARAVLVSITAAGWLAAQAAAAPPQQLAHAARAVLEGQSASVTVEITDRFADYVRQATGSGSRVFAEVSTLKTYAQAGCKRLRIVVRAPEAVAVDPSSGERKRFAFTYEMDLCADGSPPVTR